METRKSATKDFHKSPATTVCNGDVVQERRRR